MASAALLFFTSFLGLTALVAGAVGSHGLDGYPDSAREAFKTASHYQMVHGMAAMAALALAEALRATTPKAAKRVDVAAWLFAIGTTLFSGMIYAITLGAPTRLGFLIPLGGLTMMLGWCCAMTAAFALHVNAA